MDIFCVDTVTVCTLLGSAGRKKKKDLGGKAGAQQIEDLKVKSFDRKWAR